MYVPTANLNLNASSIEHNLQKNLHKSTRKLSNCSNVSRVNVSLIVTLVILILFISCYSLYLQIKTKNCKKPPLEKDIDLKEIKVLFIL